MLSIVEYFHCVYMQYIASVYLQYFIAAATRAKEDGRDTFVTLNGDGTMRLFDALRLT